MKYFRDSTDPVYREYCAEIVGLQKRFTADDRNRIVREFLSEGLNAKEVANQYHLSGAQFFISGLDTISPKRPSFTFVWPLSDSVLSRSRFR